MEAIRRSRRPIRREFDNLHRELEALLQGEPIEVHRIKVTLKLFLEVYEKLIELDNRITEQMAVDGVGDEDEDKEFQEIREYKRRAETIRISTEILIQPNNNGNGSVAGCSNTTDIGIRNFKLPVVQMRKFNGELKEWIGFWAQFQKIDEDIHMRGSDKFLYLLQSLEQGTDAYEIASGYPQSNENYPKVIEALKKRYGNEDLLLQVYIRELLNLVISNVNRKEKVPVKTLFLKLSSHLRSLKTLNLERADPATWLFPLVESSLPENILYNWQRSADSSIDGQKETPQRTRLDILMSFLEKEVDIRQRIDITRTFTQEQVKDQKKVYQDNSEKKVDRRNIVPTLSSFHAGDIKRCAFSDRHHPTAECFKSRKMTYEEIMQVLRMKGLCFRCCGAHIGKHCHTEGLKCSTCSKRHLTMLCRERRKPREDSYPPVKRQKTSEIETKTTSSNSSLECTSEVVLQTLLAKVEDHEGKEVVVRVFLDSGCQRSYILRSSAAKLNLTPVGTESVVHSVFGGLKTPPFIHNKYKVKLKNLDGSFSQIVELRDDDHVCGRIPCIRKTSTNESFFNELYENSVNLTDVNTTSSIVEILLGADVYARVLTGPILKLKTVPAVAVNTRLGWTVMGEIRDLEREDSVAHSLCTSLSITDTSISKLWELDVLGIQEPSEEKNDCLEDRLRDFTQNIRKSDKRYYVRLPWKGNRDLLPTNREVAVKRLQGATAKLLQYKLYETYDTIFKEWEKENFIERVTTTSNITHYVPHRPVIKMESLTTPVRPVFDASCRVGKTPSLNDCLHKGENFILLIPELMLRFREKRVAFVSDIRKAFQMIGVEEEDRDAMRFLWWKCRKMNEIVEFRHRRVMFGANCSPFILAAVLRHHLTNLPEPENLLGRDLLSTFYVDNCINSVETVQDYHDFRDRSVDLMKRAGMELRMWCSNVEDVDDPNTSIMSVLGVLWDRRTDELHIKIKPTVVPTKITKRVILSVVQKVFDPMGFVGPALLPLKVLLQKSWIEKKKWDEELSESDVRTFLQWINELPLIGEIRISRMSTHGVIDKSKWSLHTFSDAAKSAYSAAIFLRVQDGKHFYVQLLMSKSRVAHVKQLTIPKLELMGCSIAARLATTVSKALDIEDIPHVYWTDSSTALAWIQRNDQWGTFVANRTNAIRKITQKMEWRHIPGCFNPADLPSRGCRPSELLKSRWWEGPSWLCQEENNWPSCNDKPDEHEIGKELRKTPTALISSCLALNNMEKQYTWNGLIRVVGWVRRFLFNYLVRDAKLRLTGCLKDKELEKAELVFIRSLQQETFPTEVISNLKSIEVVKDDWGVLRVKTRLTYRDDLDNFKYPFLLPFKREEVLKLIRDSHEKYYHARTGFLMSILRNKYWILRARRTIKSVLSKCYKCRRFSAKPTIPASAPLPLDRIKDAEVYEVVGLDYAGPLVLKNGSKIWVAIFTCAVYRAVHFELVTSLSTRAFIKALNNFVQKFRRPSVIYSDNGSNFRGANNLFVKLDWNTLAKEEGVSKIEWKFNPVHSAWWGGWWERLIRTMKELLKRTIGKGTLTFVELKSAITAVEETMNCRPLTYVSEDPSDLEPITPAMFLHPFGNTRFPEADLTESEKMRFRINYVNTIKRELKNRFLKEYLALLVNRRSSKPTRELIVGELVVIGSDNKKRLEWPIGRVVQTLPGNDGVVRVVKLNTAGGEVIRSVQRLYPLEMDISGDLEQGVRKKGVTRFGRVVKPPSRYE